MHSFKEIYKYTKNLTALYVEDDKFLRKETEEILGNLFNKVTSAENGIQGLDTYTNHYNEAKEYYDIVITDLNMPLKNGLSMIKDIFKINPSQAIIVISAHDDSNRLINLIQAGIDSFIMKPIEQDQFMSILYKSSKNITNQKQTNEYLMEKTKAAQMSEMVDLIAHQWLQPITVLKMQTDLLEIENEDDNHLIQEFIDTHHSEINNLTTSIQEFRSFFKHCYEVEVTTYKKIIESVEVLLKGSLSKNNITITNNINKNTHITIVANELKHAVINIINNSIYGFIKNNVKNREIIIDSETLGDKIVLNIKNNAKGIPEDIISKIFNSDFTNKIENSNIETGLYLSSMLINKFNGKLTVSNIENGAKFKISLRKFNGAYK